MTWTILIFNALMLAWIIGGLANAASHRPTDCGLLGQRLCNDAFNTGTGIAVALLISLWVVGDIILGIIWLVTRGRSCPACGRSVRRGLVTCQGCGHDFRVTSQATI
jgi:hypothetical protein